MTLVHLMFFQKDKVVLGVLRVLFAITNNAF